MVGNDQNRAFGGHIVNARGLNTKVLLVDLPGKGEAVLDGLIVITPGVVAQGADWLAYSLHLLVQFGWYQPGFEKRCQAHACSLSDGFGFVAPLDAADQYAQSVALALIQHPIIASGIGCFDTQHFLPAIAGEDRKPGRFVRAGVPHHGRITAHRGQLTFAKWSHHRKGLAGFIDSVGLTFEIDRAFLSAILPVFQGVYVLTVAKAKHTGAADVSGWQIGVQGLAERQWLA